MKIAVVHDYFTQMGGAEIVAQNLLALFPGADLFTTVALRDQMPEKLKDVPVQTSWMQALPGMGKCYRFYLPLYPWAVQSLDLSSYDLVLSSSSGFAKGVRTRPDALHVCYCHTTPRWIWNHENYMKRERLPTPARGLLRQLIKPLKRWDEQAARRPDYFLVNSNAVKTRVQNDYGRSSTVIHPPIDVDRFKLCPNIGDYYLVLARLVSYKRIDIAIQACNRFKKKLIVIGCGPDRAALERMAGPTIEFKGKLSNQEVGVYVSSCRALIFPGEEDFGMSPLEVAAAGRPTIAYKGGGAVETILEGRTGMFFNAQTPESLMEAMQKFDKADWDPQIIRKHARQFSVEAFGHRMRTYLDRIGSGVTVPAEGASNYAAEADYLRVR